MDFHLWTVASKRWRYLLSMVRHDFYHLPEYVRLEAWRMSGTGVAAVIEDSDYFFFLPLILRPVTVLGEELCDYGGAFDGISPYGYPGPLFSVPRNGTLAVAFLRKAVQRLKEEMSSRGVISLFVRMHPLLMPPFFESLDEYGMLVKHGRTVWMDLTLSDAARWLQIRSSYRHLIRRLVREGFTARINNSDDYLAGFIRLYTQTMHRVEAKENYFFDQEYFFRLKRELENVIKLCVVEREGSLVAGGLFSECSGIVQYHLSGTDPEPVSKDATKLMLHFMGTWAKQRKNLQFHLGGGIGSADDNLLFFKSGFSKLASEFYTWRLITNPDIYNYAVKIWEKKANREANTVDSFFPLYRQSRDG